jgi:hypothetical protein
MPNVDELAYYRNLTIEQKILRHLDGTRAEAARYGALCLRLDQAYYPPKRMYNGEWDTHPENQVLGQAHVSVPVVYLTVNTKSNILGMRPPKFNIRPLDRKDDNLRRDAEFVEILVDKTWIDENMDEVHLNVCRNLSLYGRAIIQDGKDFTHNIDQQYNVWVSWRRLGEPEAMSFAEMVSPVEAIALGWDGASFTESLRFNFPLYGSNPHDDPIGARSKQWDTPTNRVLIQGQVPVLHVYTQEKKDSIVSYSLVVNGQIVKSNVSTGRKAWPFTIVEAEHIPGLTQGVGDAEPVLGIQSELSERTSAWAEAVRRTIKDQWKAWGLRHLTPRNLPGGGQVWEMTDKDEEDIEPLKFLTNDIGIHEFIKSIWANYRRITGIPDEAEGQSLSHVSGYAMNVKYQSLIVSLAPRKIRLERMYRTWALNKLDSIKRKYPKYAHLISDAQYIMQVDWEEITPSDLQSLTSRLAQGVSMKLMSPYTAMEKMQLIPEEEMRLMEEFWTNPKLNPQGAMAEAQALLMLQQVSQQVTQQTGQPAAGGGALSAQDIVKQGQESALFGANRNMPTNINPQNVSLRNSVSSPGQVTGRVA